VTGLGNDQPGHEGQSGQARNKSGAVDRGGYRPWGRG
jgi:hypothetical protein